MSESKRKVFLFAAEGCGYGDDELGFQILADLLELLADREDRPAAIVCWNTAVRMAVQGSPLLSRLRRLEENGVAILAGRGCLIELGLQDEVAVGKVASMGEILDLVLQNDVISL